MGLSQSFKFKYKNTNEIEKFLTEFCQQFNCKYIENLWVIHGYKESKMLFELVVEDYGLYTQRSGDYFEVLGFLIENLTGKFGKVEINDL